MADHLIDIVNEKDEVIGKELKSKKQELGFISRTVAIFVKDSNNKFIIAKRAMHKRLAPGKEDLAVCGNVDTGETYEQAAAREVAEETGITESMSLLERFYEEVDDGFGTLRYFCSIFIIYTDTEPNYNDEIMSYRKLTKQEIEKEIAQTPEKFCDGFINDFNKVKDKL